MNRRRRSCPENPTLDVIHAAVLSSVVAAEEESTSKGDLFHDRIQTLISVPRSKTKEDVIDFTQKLVSAARSAGDNVEYWKVLVLCMTRRRFHYKAPEARRVAKDGGDMAVAAEGDGERLLFYLSAICLHKLARQSSIQASEMASKASECLFRLAFVAGGTRDVCSMLELLTFDLLQEGGYVKLRHEVSHGRAVAAASRQLLGASPMTPFPALEELLSSAANMLDEDLLLVRDRSGEKSDITSNSIVDESKVIPELPSTINTFLPHRDRGNKGSKTSSRNLVQVIVELLIWSRTELAKTNPQFSAALERLRSISPSDDYKEIIDCVHKMQTSIRRFRKELNGAARQDGFSLSSSFQMDPSSITLSMIRRGKQADISMLQRLATKKRDQRILNLIAKRHADPKKAIAVESVVSLHRNWVPLPKEEEKEGMDEILQLELALQEATVRATIARLKTKVSLDGDTKEGECTILASLDGTATSDASAVLMAAAMNQHFASAEQSTLDTGETEERKKSTSSVRLFIRSEEYEVDTLETVIAHLDRISKAAHSSPSAYGNNDEMVEDDTASSIPESTKDVQNLIDRHMKARDRLLIFAAADLKLEQRVLAKLHAQGSSVHCHLDDEWSRRMEREGAKVGDITATLMWDSEDDLDLHAICPDGSHIYYGAKVKSGGNLDVDMNVGGGCKEPVENIFFGDAEKNIEAQRGHYKIYVQNYAYHGNTIKRGDPVPWRARLTMNGESTEYSGVCNGRGEKSNVTVCEFEYHGRTAPLPEKVGSALESSNLVSVTSSVGTTLDSLCQLMGVFKEHGLIERVRVLQEDEEVMEDEMKEDERAVDSQNAGEDDQDAMAEDDVATPTLPGLMASRASFQITNREKLYLSLSMLPARFHEEVHRSFGGPSLSKLMAGDIAKRMVENGVPIHDMRQAGYPDDVIKSVKKEMTAFGL